MNNAGVKYFNAVNLLVYKEEDFSALLSDRTSYAYSILKKGTVIYG